MDTIQRAHQQLSYRVRLEWGKTGAEALAGASVAVVVDVLSFTTTVAVAVERGIEVFPFPWRDEKAQEFAEEVGAVLAVGRGERRSTGSQSDVSLSPVTIQVARGVDRIVLPSPNGSTIAAGMSQAGSVVIAASIRNASAVGRWIAGELKPGQDVAIIASGEKWPDGSLRLAVEDLWGAGAVITELKRGGLDGFSPEALVAVSAFEAVSDSLDEEMLACASGRELVAAGFSGDVSMASQLNVSAIVPRLLDGRFSPA